MAKFFIGLVTGVVLVFLSFCSSLPPSAFPREAAADRGQFRPGPPAVGRDPRKGARRIAGLPGRRPPGPHRLQRLDDPAQGRRRFPHQGGRAGARRPGGRMGQAGRDPRATWSSSGNPASPSSRICVPRHARILCRAGRRPHLHRPGRAPDAQRPARRDDVLQEDAGQARRRLWTWSTPASTRTSATCSRAPT